MFKTEEMYEYLIDILSTSMFGKNLHQEFYIFNGADMFKTEEMYEYLIDILSTTMFGKNLHQEFYIFNGQVQMVNHY